MTTANTKTAQLRKHLESSWVGSDKVEIYEVRERMDDIHASAIEVVTPSGYPDAYLETKRTASTVNLAVTQAAGFRMSIVARMKRKAMLTKADDAEPTPAWARAKNQIADAIIAYRNQPVKNCANYEPVFIPFFNAPGEPSTIVCGGDWNLGDGLDKLFSLTAHLNWARDELINRPIEVRVIVITDSPGSDGEQTGVPLHRFNHCWEYDKEEDHWDFDLTPTSVRFDDSGYAEVRYSIDLRA